MLNAPPRLLISLIKDAFTSSLHKMQEEVELRKIQGVGFGIRIAGGTDVDPAFKESDHVSVRNGGNLTDNNGSLCREST